MVAVSRARLQRERVNRSLTAGRALLAIGGAALFLQLWAMWLEAGASLGGSTADSLGWMAALGIATLQMLDFFAFHPNGIVLGLTRLLLLCWPVAVMIAGVAISRRSS